MLSSGRSKTDSEAEFVSAGLCLTELSPPSLLLLLLLLQLDYRLCRCMFRCTVSFFWLSLTNSNVRLSKACNMP